MLVRPTGPGPLHLRIYRALREAILTGRLAPGQRLPATRTLARELSVSRNVVLVAYEQLAAEGYAVARVGAGTTVASPLPDALLSVTDPTGPAATSSPRRRIRLSSFARTAIEVRPDDRRWRRAPLRHDFRYGSVSPDERSWTTWQRLHRRVAADAPFHYAPPEGEAALRTEVAGYLNRARGMRVDASRVVITSGSQQGLDLLARVLVRPGDRVAVEEPGYPGARHALRAAGARLVPIGVDPEGLMVERITRRRGRLRLVHVTPSHQFPTGAVLPLPRRVALLAWAAAHHAYVIEDDYDSEYRYEGPPLEAIAALDAAERVLYVGTFSKVLWPSLRLGYLVLPPDLVEPVRAAKWIADRHSPSLPQRVLAAFLAGGDFDRHLRRARARHARRRDALLTTLDETLGDEVRVEGTNAGIHLLTWLPRLDPDVLEERVARAEADGIGLYPVTPYFQRPPAGAGLLFGYASLTERRIRNGIRRAAPYLRP